jgi:hypothetical protein
VSAALVAQANDLQAKLGVFNSATSMENSKLLPSISIPLKGHWPGPRLKREVKTA